MTERMTILKTRRGRKIRTLCMLLFAALVGWGCSPSTRDASPVLAFPEPGVDAPEVYRNYTTRLFHDAFGNTVQVYIRQDIGRLVNLFANGGNESMAFSVRGKDGTPVRLSWGSPGARIFAEGDYSVMEYQVRAAAPEIQLGHFLLGSMRVEREFQGAGKDQQPLTSPPFVPPELQELVATIQQLPADLQARHLKMLRAATLSELEHRLTPSITRLDQKSVLVERYYLDGLNQLKMEIQQLDPAGELEVSGNQIRLRNPEGGGVSLIIRVATNSPRLTPLSAREIFHDPFFAFVEGVKQQATGSDGREKHASGKEWLRWRRIDRQIRGMELLSSHEKLMAGLPNFATYFGRDMMMSALMMERIWQPGMLEYVVNSVLGKLKADGQVSHEEGLLGQAIRENAVRYVQKIKQYRQLRASDPPRAEKLLQQAETILTHLRATTENYWMVDDDFQFPVIVAHYLQSPSIPEEHKRQFLLARSHPDSQSTRLQRLLANLNYVCQTSRPYVVQPEPLQLVSFRRLPNGRWHSGSWRDSGAGYGGGRFALDVNAFWVPHALQAVRTIFQKLAELGFSSAELLAMMPGESHVLQEYLQDPAALQRAISTWQNAVEHFVVRLSPSEVQRRVRARLAAMPEGQRQYWEKVIQQGSWQKEPLEFLAVSLDEKGQPIPIAHTDLVTLLLLEDLPRSIGQGTLRLERLLRWLRIFELPYPVGLLIDGVGPVVSNDTYAPPEVWKAFERDVYHSPATIWGREVNLLFLGLARNLLLATDDRGQPQPAQLAPLVEKFREVLQRNRAAVEASGLQHNELWSYQIQNGILKPARYPTTSDVQLWNLTNLAVQFVLNKWQQREGQK